MENGWSVEKAASKADHAFERISAVERCAARRRAGRSGESPAGAHEPAPAGFRGLARLAPRGGWAARPDNGWASRGIDHGAVHQAAHRLRIHRSSESARCFPDLRLCVARYDKPATLPNHRAPAGAVHDEQPICDGAGPRRRGQARVPAAASLRGSGPRTLRVHLRPEGRCPGGRCRAALRHECDHQPEFPRGGAACLGKWIWLLRRRSEARGVQEICRVCEGPVAGRREDSGREARICFHSRGWRSSRSRCPARCDSPLDGAAGWRRHDFRHLAPPEQGWRRSGWPHRIEPRRRGVEG